MSDPRPADLTAQGPRTEFVQHPENLRQCVDCAVAFPSDEVLPRCRRCEQERSSAAPSRGQGAAKTRCAECRIGFQSFEDQILANGLLYHTTCWGRRSYATPPAPVASPERVCKVCGEDEPPPGALCGTSCYSGPWLTIKWPLGGIYDQERKWRAEAVAQRRRAEEAERELRRRIEQGDRFTQVIEEQHRALTASESSRAATLKLAGELVNVIEGLGYVYEGYGARLASLSSPSAPESGTQGVKDG